MKIARHLKILFLIAGMILSVKPMIGFGIIGHAKEQAELNYALLQKLFSKRKQDYLDEDLVEIIAVQRGLKDAALSFIWELCSIIFGFLITPLLVSGKTTQRYLREIFLRLVPQREIYLSTGKLTI